MDDRQFLKHYKYDERLINGQYFPSGAVSVQPGETVGVVVFNLGGPDKTGDIEPFLYHLFMDPAIIDMPFGGILRHWLSKFISTRRSERVAKDYNKIGGGSPINRLTKEQAESLEAELNNSFGKPTGVKFKVYIAMRYWHPTSEEAAKQMQQDGVDKVVLLPLYPHYSKTTTGSSLIYWWLLQQHGEIPQWPTAYVYEYAAHPKYVQAISARIDETLERFAGDMRKNVQFVFSAHGTPLHEMKKRRDRYCCLIHSTVEQVMKQRGYDFPFHVSFQSKVGPAEWLTPSTPDKLKELAGQGLDTILIIPVAFVTDHVETAFELNMLIRGQAEEFGIKHYEVMPGLNSHPLFIEALAEATVSKVTLPSNNGTEKVQAVPVYDSLGKYSERECRCHQCEFITEAVCWDAKTVKEDA